MSVLSGRRILLGVTGGIAAYKAVYLCRMFQEEKTTFGHDWSVWTNVYRL